MRPSGQTGDDELSLDDWRRVDAICDRFETAWRAGKRPDLMPLLAEVAGVVRARLLRELLVIELDIRHVLGERTELAEYVGRFPEDLGEVERVFIELGLSGETLNPQRGNKESAGNSPWKTAGGSDWRKGEITPAEISPTANASLNKAGYEIIGELGRGGMGVVYLASKIALNRPCALKMILAGAHSSKSAAARFRIEAEAVARIHHPGIVQIYHVGEADGLPYLELEYLPGGSLEKTFDGTPYPAAEAARLVETMAHAIAEAHRQGIVHRDLKPANILMDANGQPKIADFGLAKIVDSEDLLTKTNSVIGSPSYMAPEQAAGNARSADTTVDVYAIGAILYELLTGRPPFRAATALETMEQVKLIDPVPPSQLQPGLSRELETICLKCLEKSPTRRYATAEALAEDLRRYLDGEPIQARRALLRERAWKWARQRPTAAATLMLGTTTAMLLLGGSIYYNARLRHANVRLEEALNQAQIARAEAYDSAQAAITQRNLALKAFRELIFGVQDKLRASPATQALQGNLLSTAIEGLAELARNTEEAAPDLNRAIAHQKLGEIYGRVGRDLEAAQQIEQSLKLAERIVNESPMDPEVLECLAVDYFQIGWLTLQQSNPEKAEMFCRRGLEACETVAALDPNRLVARQYRIKNALQLGHTFLWRNILPQALSAFNTSLVLAQQWAIDEPNNSAPKKLILESEVKLGDAYWLVNMDWEECRSHYFKAIAIARGLVAESPSQIQEQYALALPLLNLGEYSLRAGHSEAARPLLREAEKIGKALADLDHETLNYQLLCLEAQAELAGSEMAEGNYLEAARLMRQALEKLKALKNEGKLEGQPIYGIQYIGFWKSDLDYYEEAPRVLKDISHVKSKPPRQAIKLLRFRARMLKRQGDLADLIATVDAAREIPCHSVDEMLDLAAFFADSIKSFDAIQSVSPKPQENTAVRSRCFDLGLAAMSRAIDNGLQSAQHLLSDERLKPLRAHPEFPKLLDRMRKSTPAH